MTEKDEQALGEGLTCFIVGPIGDKLAPFGDPARLSFENATQMWENVFEPACGRFGLAPVRADKISESGEIPEQIFTYLRDADIVVADVSGGNANVMYELGLRHTRDKITIQIGENERLPFDVTTIRTIKFRRTEAGLIEARNALTDALRTALEGNGKPVTATRVWNEVASLQADEIARASEISRAPDDEHDVAVDEGPGRLELMAAGEEAMEGLAATLEQFTASLQEMRTLAEEHTPLLEEAQTFAAKLTIIKQFADKLKESTEGMDSASDEYLRGVEQIDVLINFMMDDWEDKDEPPEPDEVAEFVSGVLAIATMAEQASVSFAGTVKVARDMRGWSTLLRPAAKSWEHSLNAMLRGNEMVTRWGERLRTMPGFVEPEVQGDE